MAASFYVIQVIYSSNIYTTGKQKVYIGFQCVNKPGCQSL